MLLYISVTTNIVWFGLFNVLYRISRPCCHCNNLCVAMATSLFAVILYCIYMYCNAVPQDGLYGIIIDKVDRFRELIGAPDTEKFNIVLLGGAVA